eukprot:1151325_1
MSSAVTVTLPHEGEQEEEEEEEYGFSFDEWVIENELESIKQILIQHKATTLASLSVDAVEFQSVLTDAQLFAKPHMVPKLFKAVYMFKAVIKILVADEEQQVIDSINQNLKAMNHTQQEMEKLRVDHPSSIARINASKLEQLAQSERKVNEIFDSLCDILNDRRQAILHEIDEIKSNAQQNDDDEKEFDMISLCTRTMRNCTHFLKQKQKEYDTFTSTNDNRNERKQKILNIGQKVTSEWGKTQNILKQNMDTINAQITANNALIIDIDFVVKGNVRNRFIKYVQQLGVVKNKTYNSDQERMNHEDIDSEEDDEVIIQGLRQQIEAKSRVIRELEAEKVTQQEQIQELQTNVQDTQRLNQQLEVKTRVIRDLEAEKTTQIQELRTNAQDMRRLKQQLQAKGHKIREFEAEKVTQQKRIQDLRTNVQHMQRLKQQLDVKTRDIRGLESEKRTQHEQIQSLQTNVQDMQRIKQQLEATKRANRELEAKQKTQQQQIQGKTRMISALESEKRTQQEMIQELHSNVANLSADQQRNVAQLKKSLSLASNDNSQRFAWLRSEDDEKKENDLELVKIVADNPIRIAFVDGKQQKSANDVLSVTPPVNSIDGICKCNKQMLNGVKILMKDVRDDGIRRRDDENVRNFVYSSDFDRNGICCALGTHFGTKQWRNPMELGLITVHSSSGWEYGQAKQVVAREVNG